MRVAITAAPTAVSGLTVGTRYTVQNQTAGLYVRLAVASTAPDADDAGFLLAPVTADRPGDVPVTIAAGEALYVWVVGGQSTATGAIWVGQEA